ncbi:MAG: AbrB/MazE/SpoVT family DNA-binding domain-containing protein [Oscillospiraceae bacterium]|nr:AbrB/MazE/SpoVT family DNA-binding domain-containing protein [Oscillospiraceae bacterium]
MKATAITRQIDELGRIVLPIELRRSLKISSRDALEIFVEDDKIILKKYNQTCAFCGSEENLLEFKERAICSECLEQLKK